LGQARVRRIQAGYARMRCIQLAHGTYIYPPMTLSHHRTCRCAARRQQCTARIRRIQVGHARIRRIQAGHARIRRIQVGHARIRRIQVGHARIRRIQVGHACGPTNVRITLR